MKKILVFLLSIFFIFSCVGCTDPFEGDDNDVDVAGKVSLTVGVLNDNGEYNLMVNLKKAYEKINDNVNIRVRKFNGDYTTAMSGYIQRPEDMPDIVYTSGSLHSTYSSSGVFVNLKDLMNASENAKPEMFYESVIESTHFSPSDDGIWFMPRDYNKPVTFFNKDIFAAAKIDIPTEEEWDYETFLDICSKMRTAMDNNTDQATQAIGLNKYSYPVDANIYWSPVYLGMVESFGGKMIDQDMSVSDEDAILIDSDETIAAYKKIYDDMIAPRYCMNPAESSADVFIRRGAAMWFHVRPRLYPANTAGINVDFLPMPFDKVGMGCNGYAITKEAKGRMDTLGGKNDKNNQELAWDFLQFIASEEGQNVMGATGSIVPPLKSMQNKGTWMQAISEDLNHKAFVENQDKDMSVNVVYRYEPAIHQSMQLKLDEAFSVAEFPNNWNSIETLKAALLTKKNDMLRIISNN